MKRLISNFKFNLINVYKPINRYRFLDEHDNTTSYYDTYWIKFKNIGQAR